MTNKNFQVFEVTMIVRVVVLILLAVCGAALAKAGEVNLGFMVMLYALLVVVFIVRLGGYFGSSKDGKS